MTPTAPRATRPSPSIVIGAAAALFYAFLPSVKASAMAGSMRLSRLADTWLALGSHASFVIAVVALILVFRASGSDRLTAVGSTIILGFCAMLGAGSLVVGTLGQSDLGGAGIFGGAIIVFIAFFVVLVAMIVLGGRLAEFGRQYDFTVIRVSGWSLMTAAILKLGLIPAGCVVPQATTRHSLDEVLGAMEALTFTAGAIEKLEILSWCLVALGLVLLLFKPWPPTGASEPSPPAPTPD